MNYVSTITLKIGGFTYYKECKKAQ